MFVSNMRGTLLPSVHRSMEVSLSSPTSSLQMQKIMVSSNHCCCTLIPKDSSHASLFYLVAYAASFHVPQALFSEFFGVFSQRNSSAPLQREVEGTRLSLASWALASDLSSVLPSLKHVVSQLVVKFFMLHLLISSSVTEFQKGRTPKPSFY